MKLMANQLTALDVRRMTLTGKETLRDACQYLYTEIDVNGFTGQTLINILDATEILSKAYDELNSIWYYCFELSEMQKGGE